MFSCHRRPPLTVLTVGLSLMVVAFATTAQAWWCTGHMLIAEIARQNLDDDVAWIVNKQFTFLNTWFPEVNDLVSGACWSDDLKSKHLRDMAGWHFIDQVYNPENVSITTENYPLEKNNVASEIRMLSETLRDEKWLNYWIKAFATANLVHFMGDIHQPLHATDRFTPQFPNGDYGGNLIKVYWPWDTTAPIALHAVWDSVCGQYMTEPTRPLNQTWQTFIQGLATYYTTTYPVPTAEGKVYNSTVMAEESFAAAVDYAYVNNTIQPNATLSDAYMTNCKRVAGYRISYAGIRLANELNYAFKRHRVHRDSDKADGQVDSTTKNIVDRVRHVMGRHK